MTFSDVNNKLAISGASN